MWNEDSEREMHVRLFFVPDRFQDAQNELVMRLERRIFVVLFIENNIVESIGNSSPYIYQLVLTETIHIIRKVSCSKITLQRR